MVIAVSMAAASHTVWVMGPIVSLVAEMGTTPQRLTRPTVGRTPMSDMTLDGCRIDPPVSVPTVPAAMPTAIADAGAGPDAWRLGAPTRASNAILVHPELILATRPLGLVERRCRQRRGVDGIYDGTVVIGDGHIERRQAVLNVTQLFGPSDRAGYPRLVHDPRQRERRQRAVFLLGQRFDGINHVVGRGREPFDHIGQVRGCEARAVGQRPGPAGTGPLRMPLATGAQGLRATSEGLGPSEMVLRSTRRSNML